MTQPHKHWYSRGYLPHCDTPGLLQAITFRLADSLPAEAILQLREEMDDARQRTRIEALLDAGLGACWLKRPAIAGIVEDALLHGDGKHYRLLAWCIMPNHVHVLIELIQGHSLSRIVQAWKSFTAKSINKYLSRSGTLWMADYFDRYIRDDHHLAAVFAYIHGNPVKAGLVRDAKQWRYSSAGSAGVPPACGRDVRAPRCERDARAPKKN